MLDFTTNVVPAEWRISNKGTEDIPKFNGDSNNFRLWRTRVANHVSIDQPTWAFLLQQARTCTKLITPQWLVGMKIADFNCGDLSRILFSFLGKHLGPGLFPRMGVMAGCDGNGFELWRVLFRDYEGGNDLTRTNERARLHDYPRCTDKNTLQAFLNHWIDLVRRVGGNVSDESLKIMLYNIIPADMKTDIIKNPHLKTIDQILAWITTQLSFLRSEQLVDAANSKTHSLHVVTQNDIADKMAKACLDPELVKSFVNAIQQGAARPSRDTRRTSKGKGRGRERSGSRPRPGEHGVSRQQFQVVLVLRG